MPRDEFDKELHVMDEGNRKKHTIFFVVAGAIAIVVTTAVFLIYLQGDARITDLSPEKCPHKADCSLVAELNAEGEFVGKIISVSGQSITVEEIAREGRVYTGGKKTSFQFDAETTIGVIARGFRRTRGRQEQYMEAGPALLFSEGVVYIEFDEGDPAYAREIYLL